MCSLYLESLRTLPKLTKRAKKFGIQPRKRVKNMICQKFSEFQKRNFAQNFISRLLKKKEQLKNVPEISRLSPNLFNRTDSPNPINRKQKLRLEFLDQKQKNLKYIIFKLFFLNRNYKTWDI